MALLDGRELDEDTVAVQAVKVGMERATRGQGGGVTTTTITFAQFIITSTTITSISTL
jgi:hypothetical protein